MENLMEAQEVCCQLITVYNTTINDPLPICVGHMIEDYKRLRNTTDTAVNQMEVKRLTHKQKEKWMAKKFQYVSWARDCLLLEENKS